MNGYSRGLKIILIVFILIVLTGCKSKEEGNHKTEDTYEDSKKNIEPIKEGVDKDMIKEKIKLMTLEEKIGQLLIVGLQGEEIDENTKLQIQENKVGGFILFRRNIASGEQVLKLTNDLKSLNQENRIPLFISLDEEGGIVARLADVFGTLPSAKKLGEVDDTNISYEYGQVLGLRLASLGFNIDYAPVLDINSNPNNPVIGSRSFGDNAEVVIDNGMEIIRGLRFENIIPGVKHFPGHGDTDVDSHINLPIVNKTLEELKALELLPFKEAIKEDIEMIMIAHILFEELDEKFPSSLSKNIMTGLLREELGFKGVIISDDLTMGAIMENYSLEYGAVEFLKSGGDIALICHGEDNPSLVIDKIKEAISKGEITIEDIEEKVYRILSLKSQYDLKDEIIDTLDIDRVKEANTELVKKIK